MFDWNIAITGNGGNLRPGRWIMDGVPRVWQERDADDIDDQSIDLKRQDRDDEDRSHGEESHEARAGGC